MKKVEQIKKRIEAIDERQAEIAEITKPLYDQLKPFNDESSKLHSEKTKLGVNLDEASFVPSLEYFLSSTHDKFHYETGNPKCSYSRMNKHMSDNYKYVKISGYLTKTNKNAMQLTILTDVDVDDVVKEVGPAIKIALREGQNDFYLFTDDLSASGVMALKVANGEYEITKTCWGSERSRFKGKTLKEAVKYCLDNRLT